MWHIFRSYQLLFYPAMQESIVNTDVKLTHPSHWCPTVSTNRAAESDLKEQLASFENFYYFYIMKWLLSIKKYFYETYFCPIPQHDSLAVILCLCWLIKIPFSDWFFGELAKKLVKFSLPHDFNEFIIRVSINRCSYCERLRRFLRRNILRSLRLLDGLKTYNEIFQKNCLILGCHF